MKQGLACIFACALLADCGGNNPTPPAPPLPAPSSGWAITEWGSNGAQMPATSLVQPLVFPCCSASVNWISYVEFAYTASLAGKTSITLSYTITGRSPTFVNDSPGNSCEPANPALSLLIHEAGDTGFQPSYRWFSATRTSLAIGTFTFTVPLTLESWTPVFPPGDAAGFAQALASPESIGFTLGGGCFSGHGVAVSAGSAQLTVNSIRVD